MQRIFGLGLALTVATIAALSIPAVATADEVECASEKGRRTECELNTRGEVRIVRQLSRAPCTEGQSWGLFRHGVWVSNGCRAVFGSDGGGYGRGNEPANYGGGGYGGYGGSGGAAYGASGGGDPPALITCASSGGQRAECEMDTRGEVRLVRQQSKAPCVEGQSWGLSKHGVWVSGGCRATFENVSRAGGGGGGDRGGYDGPTRQQVAACRERAGGYAEVESQEALTPGAWSIILRNDDGRFSCDVGRSGRVEGFERLGR